MKVITKFYFPDAGLESCCLTEESDCARCAKTL